MKQNQKYCAYLIRFSQLYEVKNTRKMHNIYYICIMHIMHIAIACHWCPILGEFVSISILLKKSSSFTATEGLMIDSTNRSLSIRKLVVDSKVYHLPFRRESMFRFIWYIKMLSSKKVFEPTVKSLMNEFAQNWNQCFVNN